MIVMSPSGVLAHKSCPLKAWAQREKLIVWKETPQKQRGLDAHTALEASVKNGFKPPVLPEGMNALYVTDVLTKLARLAKEHDMLVCTEHDLAVNRQFEPTTFFADDVFFRARADLLMVKPDKFALIGDWKTGNIYDYSKDQMRLEAMLVSSIYNVKIVHYRLFYIDKGQTVSGLVNLSDGLASLKDLVDIMKEMQALDKTNGPWVAKKNKFCRWCEWYHKDCKESAQW